MGGVPAADAEVGVWGGLSHRRVWHLVLGGARNMQVGHDGRALLQHWWNKPWAWVLPAAPAHPCLFPRPARGWGARALTHTAPSGSE